MGDATIGFGRMGSLEVVGRWLHAASGDDERRCEGDDGSTDDIDGRVTLLLGVDAEPGSRTTRPWLVPPTERWRG